MVIDTSAVVAILFEEPESGTFTDILAAEATRVMSVVAYYEAALVVAGRKKTPSAAQFVDDFIRDLAVGVELSDDGRRRGRPRSVF